MKKTKKIILSLLIIPLIAITLTACSKNVEGNLSDLMDKVYSEVYIDVAEDERPYLETFDALEVAPDNLEYYIGTTDIEYEEIYVTEPAMSSIAHSTVLIRMKDGADIEAAKTKIKDNVNPRKWLCVEVPEDEVIVKNKGNLIILIMVANETDRNRIEAGFDNL